MHESHDHNSNDLRSPASLAMDVGISRRRLLNLLREAGVEPQLRLNEIDYFDRAAALKVLSQKGKSEVQA